MNCFVLGVNVCNWQLAKRRKHGCGHVCMDDYILKYYVGLIAKSDIMPARRRSISSLSTTSSRTTQSSRSSASTRSRSSTTSNGSICGFPLSQVEVIAKRPANYYDDNYCELKPLVKLEDATGRRFTIFIDESKDSSEPMQGGFNTVEVGVIVEPCIGLGRMVFRVPLADDENVTPEVLCQSASHAIMMGALDIGPKVYAVTDNGSMLMEYYTQSLDGHGYPYRRWEEVHVGNSILSLIRRVANLRMVHTDLKAENILVKIIRDLVPAQRGYRRVTTEIKVKLCDWDALHFFRVSSSSLSAQGGYFLQKADVEEFINEHPAFDMRFLLYAYMVLNTDTAMFPKGVLKILTDEQEKIEAILYPEEIV